MAGRRLRRHRDGTYRVHGPSAGLRVILALVATVGGYYALPYGRSGAQITGTTGILVFAAAALATVVLIARQVRNHLIYGGRGNDIESLLLALVLVMISFALIYIKMQSQFEGLNTKTDSLYFTVTTVSTVGYGDIHPVGQGARAVVTVQMVLDLVFVAALASVAGGLIRQRAQERREAAQRAEQG